MTLLIFISTLVTALLISDLGTVSRVHYYLFSDNFPASVVFVVTFASLYTYVFDGSIYTAARQMFSCVRY